MKFSGTFIFRPSILLGKRKEIRIEEKVGGIILSFFSIFLLGRLKNTSLYKRHKWLMLCIKQSKKIF